MKLLEAVAQRWNREAIPYAVAHGIEAYPNAVGRDLDVLVRPRHVRRAIAIAAAVLSSEGCVVVRPPRIWGERIVAAVLEPVPDLLEVHAVDGISWSFVRLAGEPEPSARVGPFPVDPWVRFAKRVLLPAFAGDLAKLTAELQRHPVDDAEAAAARSRLPTVIGRPLAESFQRGVQECDEPLIANLIPVMRKMARRRAWARQPTMAVRRTAAAGWRRIRQPFAVCAPIISIVGPPGAGKTLLQESICDGDQLVFTRCVRARWASPRPPAASHAQHWGRLAAHVVRGVLRGFVDRLHSSRQRLVVYEGSPLDLEVNPRRFGLRSAAGVRWCQQFLPKPDLILLLDRPVGTICGRDADLSAAQVTVEYSAWHSLLSTARSAIALRTERDIGEIRSDAIRHIVETFISKNTSRRSSD